MPKMKTHSGAKKRFKTTATGKLLLGMLAAIAEFETSFAFQVDVRMIRMAPLVAPAGRAGKLVEGGREG
mgnify:CR=1 FL=1